MRLALNAIGIKQESQLENTSALGMQGSAAQPMYFVGRGGSHSRTGLHIRTCFLRLAPPLGHCLNLLDLSSAVAAR